MTKFRPTDTFCKWCEEPASVHPYREVDAHGVQEWVLCDACHPDREERPVVSIRRFVHEEVAA